MRIYIGFDDTDVQGAPMGTGRLARMFASLLPEGCTLTGVVRQQLLKEPGIPYTSNNSSACLLVEAEDAAALPVLVERATAHLLEFSSDGSDPGLCVAHEGALPDGLAEFAMRCTGRPVSQADAMRAAAGLHLEGLGGTNDGIIGAAAAVGLTSQGWCGRFIEYGRMRSLVDPLTVADLNACGIRVLSVDRDATVPLSGDHVVTAGWLRPSLWGGAPVLQVRVSGRGEWTAVHGKRKKNRPGDGPLLAAAL